MIVGKGSVIICSSDSSAPLKRAAAVKLAPTIHLLADPHIGEAQVAFLVEHEILRFDVSVHDAVRVQVAQRQQDAAR